MEQMTPPERRELFVEAGSGQTLSREEAIELAAQLREASAELEHIGGEAAGQAAVVVDMLRAVAISEQEQTLRDLRRRRPEVAQAVMRQMCLETAALVVSPQVVGDAMLRTPIESLSALARGTRADVREHLLEHAPSNIRGPLLQEIELEVPAARSEYLEARAAFTESMASILQREGEDLVAVNTRALGAGASPPAGG